MSEILSDLMIEYYGIWRHDRTSMIRRKAAVLQSNALSGVIPMIAALVFGLFVAFIPGGGIAILGIQFLGDRIFGLDLFTELKISSFWHSVRRAGKEASVSVLSNG
jgi:hypothetical protein